jgi:hypothetical protein
MSRNVDAARVIGHTSVPARASTRDGTRIAIDVTEAARQWQRHPGENRLVLVSAPRSDCLFHGPGAADPRVRPVLHLIGHGAAGDVACIAADELGPHAPELRLGGQSAAALRVAGIDPNLMIIAAHLVLTVKRNGSAAPEPIYVAELQQADPALGDLWDDPNAYFRSQAIGFDPASPSAYERNLRHQVTHPPEWKRASWAEEDGEHYLRIAWDPTRRSGSFKIPVFHPRTNVEAREVMFEYDVRVAQNFSAACREGGKFPGFCSSGKRSSFDRNPWPGEPAGRSAELRAGNGGSNVHGDDGWSARGGYLRGYDRKKRQMLGYVPLYTYSYHLSRKVGDRVELWHEAYRRYEELHGLRGRGYTVKGRLRDLLQPGEVLGAGASRTGQRLDWDHAGSPAGLLPGTWHRVAQRMRINEPGQHDGRIDAFLDGRQVAKIDGVCWRSTRNPLIPGSTLGIGAVWFNFYHGGTLFPVGETSIDVKRVAVKVLDWDTEKL